MIEVYVQSQGETWFAVACQNQQILAVSFAEDQKIAANKVMGYLPLHVPFRVLANPSAFAQSAFASLKRVYDGEEPRFEMPLATGHLTAYAQKVLKTTMKIPIGFISTYSAVAEAAGGGPRAVGNIMAGNPFAPIVPCHRVVKSDFSLGGYGGGLRVKVALLRKESRGFAEPRRVRVTSGFLRCYPVERVLERLDAFAQTIKAADSKPER
jgi:methylated-DNA-[protein]-cysteine S-methyltransferase